MSKFTNLTIIFLSASLPFGFSNEAVLSETNTNTEPKSSLIIENKKSADYKTEIKKTLKFINEDLIALKGKYTQLKKVDKASIDVHENSFSFNYEHDMKIIGKLAKANKNGCWLEVNIELYSPKTQRKDFLEARSAKAWQCYQIDENARYGTWSTIVTGQGDKKSSLKEKVRNIINKRIDDLHKSLGGKRLLVRGDK